MRQKYRMFLRGSVYWTQDNTSRKQESLGTKDRTEARRLFNAKNEAHRQPNINLQIARAYLMVSDPDASKRTWKCQGFHQSSVHDREKQSQSRSG